MYLLFIIFMFISYLIYKYIYKKSTKLKYKIKII